MPLKRLHHRLSAVEEMHKRPPQRPINYQKEKLFKHSIPVINIRRGEEESLQSTSNNSYAEELLAETTKTPSVTMPKSYWSNSSAGYFAYRQQQQQHYAGGHRNKHKCSRQDLNVQALSDGELEEHHHQLTLVEGQLPHNSNAKLALKRFSDTDFEDMKQHKPRYYGEFIMQNQTAGTTTNSSTVPSESGNSSQQCLISVGGGKSSNTVNSMLTNHENTLYNKNKNLLRAQQQLTENVITINVEEPETLEINGKAKKRQKSNRLQKTVTLNVDDALRTANPNMTSSNDTATTKFYQSFDAARKFTYPNMTLLRRINDRYKKTEHFFVALKIFAFIHLVLSLIMLALDWAQAALLWDETNPTLNVHRKIYLILRCLYPVYILAIAAASSAVALHKRLFNKTLKLLCIVLLAVSCLMPNDTILVQSVAEAIQFSTVKRQLTSKEITETLQSMGHFNDEPESSALENNGHINNLNSNRQSASVVPRLVFSSTAKQTTKLPYYNNVETAQQSPDFSITLNEIVNNPRAYKNVLENYIAPYVKRIETFNTVHHLRIAYCLFGVVHLVLTVLTLFTAVRLETAP